MAANSGAGGGPAGRAAVGTTKPVLVFDLDGTIAGNYVNFRRNKGGKDIKDIEINENIIEVLKLADKARIAGQLGGIFLLTNNSDIFYIFLVQYIVGKLVSGSTRNAINSGNGRNIAAYNFFDDIMSRNDNRRPFDAAGDPPKRVEDVRKMLEEVGQPTDNLEGRIFFFDDRPDHTIGREIIPAGGKYIQITPSYSKGVEDRTDYSEIVHILESLLAPSPAAGGGKRKKRRVTRKNLKPTHKK
jgi:hypothetical protein